MFSRANLLFVAKHVVWLLAHAEVVAATVACTVSEFREIREISGNSGITGSRLKPCNRRCFRHSPSISPLPPLGSGARQWAEVASPGRHLSNVSKDSLSSILKRKKSLNIFVHWIDLSGTEMTDYWRISKRINSTIDKHIAPSRQFQIKRLFWTRYINHLFVLAFIRQSAQ